MEGQTMLRALSLAVLMISAGPTLAAEATDDDTTIAQQHQQTAPQSAPRRGCERNQDGIS